MIVSLGSGASQSFIFVAAMLGGMAVYNLTRTAKPLAMPQPAASAADS